MKLFDEVTSTSSIDKREALCLTPVGQRSQAGYRRSSGKNDKKKLDDLCLSFTMGGLSHRGHVNARLTDLGVRSN